MEDNNSLIKKGLFIEKTTQIIKIVIMLSTFFYLLWFTQKELSYLEAIISLLK